MTRCFWVVVAMSVIGSSASLADRAKPKPPRESTQPASPVPTILDVRKLMSKSAFQGAGLSKLDANEIAVLNQWLTDFSGKLLIDKQNKAGCKTPIETSIDGEFEGWAGETLFKLMNGQIWKQSSYSYTYTYKYSPSVVIYDSGGSCKLKVDGVNGEISVERLK
jgi:hypothetical protein